MGGGLMQLVAYGAQDIYLTGNPQITFFKVVYRRHTNFSMECVQQTVSGISTILNTASSQATVMISRNGDLIHQIWVRCDQDSTNGISGDHLVEIAEIEIGGHRIDKQTKEWMQIWTELTTLPNQIEGFKYLTGGYTNNLVTQSGTNQQSIMYPLQFWFCRDIGLSLPLIALQYHEVKLKLTWGSGAASSGLGRNGSAVTPSCEVWVDYIYLDTDERRRFAQVSHEYLIEQIQIQDEGIAAETYKLNFEHPVKELIWTTNPTLLKTQKLKLELNGHDRFSEQDKEYFQIKQPIQHHSSVPGFNIKETEDPILIQPIVISYRDAGTATGTATSTLHNTVSSTSGTKTTFSLLIGTNFIASTTASNYPRVGDLLSIEIRDHSEIATGARRRNVVVQVISVASRTNGWNIGVELEDDNNAIGTAFIAGTTADDMVSISIIARTQNPRSRCSQLSKEINIFSFAIHPEDHQPSGACNFSKIDHAKLMFNNSSTIDTIYAVNYNVLRIMSGMGGLAYAN